MSRPPLPKWSEPVIDPKTGMMTQVWRTYFEKLEAYLKSLET